MKNIQPPSLKEERAYDSHTFQCGCYIADPDADSFSVPPHWHEELEIIHFQRGHFILEVNMERYQIDSECLFFINSGELHRIICNEPCLESAVIFSPYLLCFISNDAAQSRLIQPLANGGLLLPRMLYPGHEGFTDILHEYSRILAYCKNNGPFASSPEIRQLYIKAALLNMLGVLTENKWMLAAREPKNESIEAIKTVLSYIHEHFSEKIYISDLAGLLNLNEQYFCRFFKKAIGQSPISYLNEYRIRQAIELLCDTSMPVTDICLECGFNNFGNFLREFRKQTGMTPLQLKQKSK